MPMLVCYPCRNTGDFVQVSERGDARLLSQTHASGLRAAPWLSLDDRLPGLYCARCREPLEMTPSDVDLTDDRIDFVGPMDFDAEQLAAELLALRPDANWTRLTIDARPPTHAPIPDGLHPSLLDALERSGRSQLYTHQATAIAAALGGRHVVQATSAGSGKSLGFVLPVLDALLRDPTATALMVFPLRALANDQLQALASFGIASDPWVDSSSLDLLLSDAVGPLRVSRYDGSTPEHERGPIRSAGRLLVTTPDMLHASVIHHSGTRYRDGTGWARLFRGLRFVVIDEIHSYQGVFGSNVAHVLRRLRRTATRYGATMQFLAASATVGNPRELAETLTGVPDFTLVDEDGSPRARRIVLLCNPPLRSSEAVSVQESKRSLAAVEEAPWAGEDEAVGRIAPQTVAIELMAQGALASAEHLPVRTIAFCRSRNQVFQLAQRVRNALKETRRSDLADAVAAYAATFLRDDREDAEGRLRDGSTLAVVSTNALELGIDIPELSFAVLVGYPGQISSFRQRIGRVGRRGEGLAVLIVGDDPLQQFLARSPETLDALLHSAAESIVVSPGAPEIARRFGLLPAQEEFGGIAYEDEEFFGPIVREWLAGVTGRPATEIGGRPYWKVEAGESAGVGIRDSIGSESYTVFHQERRDLRPIGVLDSTSCPRDAFVPAIWTAADGNLYKVVGFDPRLKEIYCEGPVDAGFLTRGIPVDRVEVVAEHWSPIKRSGAEIGYGRLHITRNVFSYKELHFSGAEHNRQVERQWPPVEFDTDGLFVRLPANTDISEEAVRATEHALLSTAPSVVACDPYDLEATSDHGTIYLYDAFGGGIRLSEPVFSRFDEVVSLAREIVATCPCQTGCPACVMLMRRPEGNRELSKAGALAALELLQLDPQP